MAYHVRQIDQVRDLNEVKRFKKKIALILPGNTICQTQKAKQNKKKIQFKRIDYSEFSTAHKSEMSIYKP